MRAVWKQQVKRAVSGILAGVMALSLSFAAFPTKALAQGYGKNGTVRDMSSADLVKDMGLGYNLGNTFDSIGSYITASTPQEYQTGWGNKPLTQHFINKVKEGGFKTIRFPVSWAQWIDGNNQIDPVYMSAVQEVVDWCMDADLYVILNLHHDGGGADTSWIRNASQDYAGISEKYRTVWNQIANHFAGYGDHLIFESMNEVYFPDVDLSRQYEILNGLNQIFVDTVRAAGGNNASRHLLIAGYNTDIARTCDRRYQMPNDPANHLMLSIHYYSPSPFCVATRDVDWAVPQTTWGTEADLAQVRTDLDNLAKRFTSQGTPVIIGEYGVLTEDDKEVASIQRYLREVPRIILEYGMCPILWDTSNAGDMKTIERVSGEFYDPVVKSNYQALAAELNAGQINRHNYSVPTYRQVQVEASPDGWVSIASYNPEELLGIRFSVTCSSSWDSYGGGGLYIDGWENTPNWQFNSVYDEIEYIFTAEERARLQDRLGIQIWWTDESQGGSHADELSIENNTVTLLYADGASVDAAGTKLAAPGGGSGGSGGGGGGGGSSSHGSAGRPNYSTDPAPSGDDDRTDGVRTYDYVLNEDRSGIAEGETDNTTGVQTLDLAQICPGYKVGDTVRITVTPKSDGGYSYALQATQGGSWSTSDSWGEGASNSWECTPDDGKAAVYLWYLGGSYFMFNVSVEVTHAAPVVEEVPVNEGESLDYQLGEILEESQIPEGARLKMTVTTRAAVEGEPYRGTISYTDVNGVRVQKEISNESPAAILYGVPEGTKLTIKMETGNAVISGLSVDEAQEGEAAEDMPLAQMEPGTTVVLPESVVEEGPEASEGQESGLKIYVANGDGLSGVAMINGDWNQHLELSAASVLSDDKGTYIWYPWVNPESVNEIQITTYWTDSALEILSVEAVMPEEAETFEAIEVPLGTTEEYQVKTAGPVHLTVTVEALEAGKGYSGNLSFTDENGTIVTRTFSNVGDAEPFEISDAPVSVNLYGVPAGQKITVYARSEDGSKPVESGIRVTNIQETELEDSAYAYLEQATTVKLPGSLVQKGTEVTEESQAGLKIYVENREGSTGGGVVVINGDWNTNLPFEFATDEKGDYLWYSFTELSEKGEVPTEITQVEITSYYSDPPLEIVKIEELRTAGGEEPEQPEFVEKSLNMGENTTYKVNHIDSSLQMKVELVGNESGKAYSGAISYENENGTKIYREFNSQDSSATTVMIYGNPDEITINAYSPENGAGFTIKNITEEVNSETEAIAKIQVDGGFGEITLPSTMDDNTGWVKESNGIKVFVQDKEMTSGTVYVNSQWDTNKEIGQESGKSIYKTDESGTYIWYPLTDGDETEITSVTVRSYWGTLTIVSPSSEKSVTITQNTPYTCNLKDWLPKEDQEILDSDQMEITLNFAGNGSGQYTVDTYMGDPEIGEIHNWKTSDESDDNALALTLYGKPADDSVKISVKNIDSVKLTSVKVAKYEDEIIAKLAETGELTIPVSCFDEAETDGAESGIRIYVEPYNGGIKINNESVQLGENEDYIFYTGNADDGLKILAEWFYNSDFTITKIVPVTAEEEIQLLAAPLVLTLEEIPTATESSATKQPVGEPMDPEKEESKEPVEEPAEEPEIENPTEEDKQEPAQDRSDTPEIPQAPKPEEQFPPAGDEEESQESQQEQDKDQEPDGEEKEDSKDETPAEDEKEEAEDQEQEAPKEDIPAEEAPDEEAGSQETEDSEEDTDGSKEEDIIEDSQETEDETTPAADSEKESDSQDEEEDGHKETEKPEAKKEDTSGEKQESHEETEETGGSEE